MIILVLNAGSSSLKYRLFAMPAEQTLAQGLVERLGENDCPSSFRHQVAGRDIREGEEACRNHGQALALVLDELIHPSRGCVASLAEIDALGHRVVHGGEIFTAPIILDGAALKRMASLVELAPLHMPPALACIDACAQAMPALPQVAHFDTVFHRSMPEHAYLYPVPPSWHTEHGVRRYGFHGLSHEHAVQEASRLLGRSPDDLRLVTAHLGNGASLAAWDRGRVADTSMGFTPLEGIMMGTRPGWIDAALVPHLSRRLGESAEEVISRLNRECGLLGVSGISRDLRVIGRAKDEGHQPSVLAWKMFVSRLLKCLGAYVFAMGGTDGVVLTGGMGENAWELRCDLFATTANLGMELDPEANRALAGGRQGFINTRRSPIKLLVVGAQEELVIARAASHLLLKTPNIKL